MKNFDAPGWAKALGTAVVFVAAPIALVGTDWGYSRLFREGGSPVFPPHEVFLTIYFGSAFLLAGVTFWKLKVGWMLRTAVALAVAVSALLWFAYVLFDYDCGHGVCL